MIKPEHIDQDLNGKELFLEVDELYDPEGEPPDGPYYW